MTPRRKPVQRERSLQQQVVNFLNHALPPHSMVLAIPGGDRQATRTPGYVAGTPDLMILHLGDVFFVELKAGRAGRVSPAQATCHQAMAGCGCPVTICRTLQDVADACMDWAIPLRGRLAA